MGHRRGGRRGRRRRGFWYLLLPHLVPWYLCTTKAWEHAPGPERRTHTAGSRRGTTLWAPVLGGIAAALRAMVRFSLRSAVVLPLFRAAAIRRCFPAAPRGGTRIFSAGAGDGEDPGSAPPPLRLESQLARAGCSADSQYGGMSPPLHFATTFERDAHFDASALGALPPGYSSGFVYSRLQHPTRAQLEAELARAEGAWAGDPQRGGASEGKGCGLAFASGQAAAAALLHAAGRDARLLLADDVYHGVRYLVTDMYASWGLQHRCVDTTDLASLESEVDEARRADSGIWRPPEDGNSDAPHVIVWLETPSNPLLKVSDVRRICELLDGRATVVVDSTWQSPATMQPLLVGADVVMHSLTKYIGGHSDMLGGALVFREQESALLQRTRAAQALLGSGLAPMDCWLALRGLRSLAARMRVHSENGMAVAAFLQGHSRVRRVHYPGLASHPQHAVAREQMVGGFGGMISFELGSADEAIAVAGRLRLFGRATSLGGTESLVEHRRSVEGPVTSTPGGLLRLSVGIENKADLIADLSQALDEP